MQAVDKLRLAVNIIGGGGIGAIGITGWINHKKRQLERMAADPTATVAGAVPGADKATSLLDRVKGLFKKN
jgi:hypothetical protein